MLVTESQARTKWCPLMQLGSCCVAESCGLFRWMERSFIVTGKTCWVDVPDADLFDNGGGRWVSQIKTGQIRISLGTFDTELEAAAAYDAAAATLHGEYARLNLSPIKNSGRLGYCGLAGTPDHLLEVCDV